MQKQTSIPKLLCFRSQSIQKRKLQVFSIKMCFDDFRQFTALSMFFHRQNPLKATFKIFQFQLSLSQQYQIIMYSQFLLPTKRLYHLVGNKEDCELVKNAYEVASEDRNEDLVITQNVNFDYKKNNQNKIQPIPLQGGILKSYWFDKVLQKKPMLVILVFNLSKPMEPLQKWEDRLQTITLQINKARDYLKTQQNSRVSMATLILTPNNILVPIDKIKEFTKIQDRSLQILELQSLKTQMKRIKNSWQGMWVKQMEDRIKSKQKQQALKDQTKLRAYIKIAVLKQITNNDDLSQYQNARFFCKRFYQSIQRTKDDDINLILTKMQLRFLGDVLFLKGFKQWYKSNPVQSMNKLKAHFYEFKDKDLQNLGIYFCYEQLYWRSQFLFEVLGLIMSLKITANIDNRIAELIKGFISYNIELSKLQQKIKLEEIVLEELPQEYFGRLNYKVKDQAKFNADFKNTRLSLFISKQKQFLLQAQSIITRFQETGKVKKHEQLYLIVSQCRLYILQNNFQKSVSTYNSIVDSFMKKNDYFTLNCLLKQFQPLLSKNQHHSQLVKFYLVAIKVLDYFRSLQSLPEMVKQLKSTASELKNSLEYQVPRGSCLLSAIVDYQTITSLLCDKISMKINLDLHRQLEGLFTSMDIKFKSDVAQIKQLQFKIQQIIEIQPSDYLAQQDILEIEQIRFYGNNLIWIIKGDYIEYTKKNRVYITMPMNDPVVKIIDNFKRHYVNEAIPIQIKILCNNSDTKVNSKVIFGEEKNQHSALCFQNPQQPINLLDTQTPVKLPENVPHIFYLKFPQQGQRKVKISIEMKMIKTYTNSKGQKKEVMRTKKYNQDVKFTLEPILIVSKRLTVPGNELLTKKIQFKEGIFRVPVNQNVMIQYSIESEENIVLTQIKQTQLDDSIKFIKNLDMRDIELQSKASFKLFSIIQIVNMNQSCKIPPLLLKWRRTDQVIQNFYIDTKEQITTKQKSLSIELKQIEPLKKGEVGTIHYTVNNYLPNKLKVRVEAFETQAIMIVGKNKTQLHMGENSHVVLSFKVLPLTVGEILLPELQIRIDQKFQAKIERRHIAFVI